MCDTVLPECHTENWVWVVLQAKTSRSLFSNKPNGGKQFPLQQQRLGIPVLASCFHFHEPSCHSRLFQTLMQIKINTVL